MPAPKAPAPAAKAPAPSAKAPAPAAKAPAPAVLPAASPQLSHLPPEYQNLPMAGLVGSQPMAAVSAEFQGLPMASFAPGSGPTPAAADPAPGPTAKKKKKKKKKGTDLSAFDDDDQSGEQITLKQFLLLCVGTFIGSVVLGFLLRDLSSWIALTGTVIWVAGMLWISIQVIMLNPLALIIPFLGIYVILSEFESFKIPLTTVVLGMIMAITSLVFAVGAGVGR